MDGTCSGEQCWQLNLTLLGAACDSDRLGGRAICVSVAGWTSLAHVAAGFDRLRDRKVP